MYKGEGGVDLLGEFPKRIKIGIKREDGKVFEKWIPIKYDYLPKYCETCLIQGHDETQCYVKNPKLYKKKEEVRERRKRKGRTKQILRWLRRRK